ncbi:MAG: tetratricopeptide repeat protein [Candidatus Omnitrophota bacterium]
MKILIFITVILLCTANVAFCGLARNVKQGNQAYDKGNYDQALIKYNDAQIDDPQSPEVFYNMGNVFYRQKKYKEAIDAFEKSTEKAEVGLQAKALYNIGNSFFNQGQLRQALESYKQSLERNPDDLDTKYNIEYTEKKIKEMLSQSQQTQQQAEKDRQQQQQDQQQSQGQQQEQQEQKQAPQQQVQTAQDQPSAQDQQAQSAEKKNEEELTKEEADRFLSAFGQDQKNLLPPQPEQKQKGMNNNVEKDW